MASKFFQPGNSRARVSIKARFSPLCMVTARAWVEGETQLYP